MIEIEVGGGGVLLKKLDRSRLNTVAELYNCNCDIRYATGITNPVSYLELSERLYKPEASKNEFLTGIFIPESNHAGIDRQPQLAGLVTGVLQDKTIWIKLVAILPQFRRIGLGSKSTSLLLHYCNVCFSTRDAFLSVIENNNIGVLFWLNQGFTEAGRFNKKLFDDEQHYEVLIMYKRL